MLKKQNNYPKPFPANVDEIKYPEHALKIGNPLFMTSNMTYGS